MKFKSILCGILSLFAITAQAMETNENFTATDENDGEIDVSTFADGKFPCNVFIKTPLGRQHILHVRSCEKAASNSVANMPNSATHNIISSGVYYSDLIFAYEIIKAPHMRTQETEEIDILIEAVTDIEWLLEEKHSTMLSQQKKIFEKTRLNDLYLLAEMLKKDNFGENINIYGFPERLKKTHKNWPPENNSNNNEVFSPYSGYTRIKKALEIRKKQKIDALTPDKEAWFHPVVPSETSENKINKATQAFYAALEEE